MRGRGHSIRSRFVPSRGGGGQARWRGQGRSNHRVLTATPELLLLYERYYPMRGYGSCVSAARFCPAFEEQRQYFRPVTWSGERVSLAERRRRYREHWAAVMDEVVAA